MKVVSDNYRVLENLGSGGYGKYVKYSNNSSIVYLACLSLK